MKIPSFVDIHVHLRDPGLTHKEDIESGMRAAYYGGFSVVCCMPNTSPTLDSPEQIKYVLEKSKGGAVRVLPIGAITYGLKGERLTEFEALKKAGAVAVSDDGMPVQDTKLFEEALVLAREVGIPIAAHSEDFSAPNSRLAEIKGVERDINSAIKTGCPLHICHVSTTESIELVRQAKRSGGAITAETCPHYFSLTTSDFERIGANAKMNPTLRERADIEAVIEGLKDGTIDAIATDHAPHAKEEKEGANPPNGIIGLETAFAVSYTYLVRAGHLTLEELIEKMTTNPAKIFSIVVPKTEIEVDLETPFIVPNKFHSKSINSPWWVGAELYGRVLR